jgi:hypothetical protein
MLRTAISIPIALFVGSVLLLTYGSVSALAQTREQKIDELVSKAGAKDAENGFCASTGWPNGDKWEIFEAFLRGAQVGTSKINTFGSGACELNRVTRVHQEGTAKCVTYDVWMCAKGGRCGTNTVVDCLEKNGKLRRKQ